MGALAIGNIDTQMMGSLGLADAGNIVVLAFHRHQGDAFDGFQVDQPAAMQHFAFGQSMADKHRIDRLQVEFGGQIHHGHIFIIEFAVLLGRIAVAVDEMTEHVAMGRDVLVDIHRHKAGQLQEAGIDLAHETGIGQRHFDNAVFLEPVDAAFLRQLVDHSRAFARINRPPHQGHRIGRAGIIVHFHQPDGRQNRDRGLAHRQHMYIRTEESQHITHIIDIIIQIETARRHRHKAGVDPIGDIDFMGLDEGFDRAAQQRGVMARHRRDNQQFGLAHTVAVDHPVKMDQIAKGILPHDMLGHGNAHTVDLCGRQIECGLAIATRRALEQFASGGERAANSRFSGKIGRIIQHPPAGLCHRTRGTNQRMGSFVPHI